MAGVNRDAVAAQVGHTGDGIEEKFYLDEKMLNPALSSRAIYDLIDAPSASQHSNILRLAVGAESHNSQEMKRF